MPLAQMLLDALLDPFRIALIIGLVYTMQRTRAQSGVIIPLAAGVVFVAVILPTTRGTLGEGSAMVGQLGVGLVANILLLAVVLAVWEAVRRRRR